MKKRFKIPKLSGDVISDVYDKLVKNKKRIISVMMTGFLTYSCSLPGSSDSTNPDFKIKNMQENEEGVSYKGNWDTSASSSIEDVPSGFVTRFSMTENSAMSFHPSSQWSLATHSGASGGSFNHNNSKPYDKVENKFKAVNNDIKYSDGLGYSTTHGQNSWLRWNNNPGQDYDYTYSVPNTKENNGGSVDFLPSSGNSWFISENSYGNISHTDSLNDSLEFLFTGTNVHIHHVKGPNRAIANIQIFNSDNTLINADNQNFDGYSPTWVSTVISFKALKADTYTVKIKKSPLPHNPNSTGLYIDFNKAVFYPSAEYNFEDINVVYKVARYINRGKVEVTPDGDTSKTAIIDLYGVSSPYFHYVKAFSFDKKLNADGSKHRITIEPHQVNGVLQKNPSSSDYIFGVDNFGALPYAAGNFTGTELNIINAIHPQYGKADVYINDERKATIDLYNSSFGYKFNNIQGGNSTGTNNFKLVSTYDNDLTNPGVITMDAFTGVNEVTFTFKTISSSQIATFSSVKGPDQGLMKVFLDGQYYTTTQLYSSNVNLPKDTAYESFTMLSPGIHTLKLVPAYQKHTSSTGYKINVDELKMQNGDAVCDP